MKIRDRIKELRRVKASAILPNPRNWRTHPKAQQDAMRGILAEVGFAAACVAYETPDGLMLIDGHLRTDTVRDEEIPVLVLDVTEDEANKLLLSMDPLSAMAGADASILEDLMKSVSLESESVAGMLSDLLKDEKQKSLDERYSDGPKNAPLADRFVAPPFSVLDARQGYWSARKKEWLDFGVDTISGRDNIESRGPVANSHLPSKSKTKSVQESDGVSSFDPVLVEVACRWFCPEGGSVLDPFAGGPVRGCVSSCVGRRYTGFDVRLQQVEQNKITYNAVKQNLQEGLGDSVWIHDDCRNMGKHLKGRKFDLVLSCPPYADLEVYSKQDDDISAAKTYKEFLAMYRQCIAAAVEYLNDDAFAFWVVGDVRGKNGNYQNFVSDTIQSFLDCGMYLYNEACYISPIGSRPLVVGKQFSASRKLGKLHQNVLVFLKGSASSALKKLSPVDATLNLGESYEGDE